MMMKRKLATLLAATTFLAVPAPSYALFGPVCIPRIQNCFCTYLVPCPVSDIAKQTKLDLENGKILNAINLIKGIQDPQTMLMKAVNGELSGMIPGIDAIGIDISSLAPEGLMDVTKRLASAGITPQLLQNVISGNVSASDFLGVAVANGLDMSALQKAGISPDLITSIASGNVSPDAILALADGLDFKGTALQSLGVTPELISSIANGRTNPAQLLEVAQNAGLDLTSLKAAGIDPNAIVSLAKGNNQEALMGIMQSAGYGSSVLRNLNIDASTLGSIASGKLPASSIQDLMSKSGIDPNAILIPSVNGPVSLSGSTSGLPQNMITIPANQIPGLEEILKDKGQRAGMSGGGGGGATTTPAPAANTAAACTPSQSLISVLTPPSDFGDDQATIDFALSQGDIHLHQENLADGMDEALTTYGYGVGRSAQIRPLLLSATKNLDAFQSMMDDSKSLRSDIQVNSVVKKQLISAQAELASLYTSYSAVAGAEDVTPANITEVPTFPQDSKWQDVMAQSTSEKTQPASTAAADLKELSRLDSNFTLRAKNAILYHSLQKTAQPIRDAVPNVVSVIQTHEDYKSVLYRLEGLIRAKLRIAYINPDAAWAKLKPELEAKAGDYYDGNKWNVGNRVAMQINGALLAERPSTRYGMRASGGTNNTAIGVTAYSYAFANKVYGKDDPVKVVRPPPRSSDDAPPPPNMIGLLQNYLAAVRRERMMATLRRGPADETMTASVWNEMVNFAPRKCLSGPIEATPENISARPELFDLSAQCDHLVWENGDAGDYIPYTDLGGADASLWMAKVSLTEIDAQTGGRDGAMAAAQDAIDYANQNQLISKLQGIGHSSTAQHIAATLDVLGQVKSDTGFTQEYIYPTENQVLNASQ